MLVQVIDVNEFAPSFMCEQRSQCNSYTINVSETHPLDTAILTLHAQDADADGVNEGHVTYSVLATPDDAAPPMVTVNELSGELFLTQSLDYDTLQDLGRRLHVLVLATDSGSPNRLTSSATVTVNVLDENDNVPEIRISCNEEPLVAGPIRNVLYLEENSDLPPAGETDCRVTAIDADSGVFGQVHCLVSVKRSTDKVAKFIADRSDLLMNTC